MGGSFQDSRITLKNLVIAGEEEYGDEDHPAFEERSFGKCLLLNGNLLRYLSELLVDSQELMRRIETLVEDVTLDKILFAYA
jgi:hypothetical protein